MPRWPVGKLPKSAKIGGETTVNGTPFPTYQSDDDVVCFRCDKGVSGPTQASGYAKGRGQWRRQCSHCGAVTYFDLSES